MCEKTIDSIVSFLLTRIKSNSRTPEEKGQLYGRTSPLEVTLTFEQLKNKILSNGFRCEKTNIPFPIPENDCSYTAFCKGYYNKMLLPSVDRIDCKKGYTNENIQIILRGLNMGKQSYDDENLTEFINLIKSKDMKKENVKIRLLNHLLDSKDWERSEMYFFERILNNEDVKEPKTKIKPGRLNKDVRKKEIINRAVNKEYTEGPEYITITDFTKTKTNGNAFGSKKLSPQIIENVTIYYDTKGKGNVYFMEKSELQNVLQK